MKSSTKIIKFFYYQLTVDRKIGDGRRKMLFDLTEFATLLKDKTLEERNWEYHGEQVRLKVFQIDENNILHMQFERLTNNGMPYIAKEFIEEEKDVPLEEDEFIANDVNAIFDLENCVFMLQRNIQSLSQIAIENYINYFWNLIRNDDEKEIISFNPIINNSIYSEAKSKKEIKKLTIKTANKYDSKKGIRQKTSDLIDGVLGKIIEASKPADGLNLELTFSTSRSPTDTMDDKEVLKIIQQIEKQPFLFDKAQVSVISDNNRTEILNLLNALLMDYDIIEQPPKTRLNPNVIRDLMVRAYLPVHEGKNRKHDINVILQSNS